MQTYGPLFTGHLDSGRATISPTTFLPELQLLCPVDGYNLSSKTTNHIVIPLTQIVC